MESSFRFDTGGCSCRSRLVEEDDLRVGQEGPHEVEAHLHALGVGGDALVGVGGEADEPHQLLRVAGPPPVRADGVLLRWAD
jgi:hypothetical protein